MRLALAALLAIGLAAPAAAQDVAPTAPAAPDTGQNTQDTGQNAPGAGQNTPNALPLPTGCIAVAADPASTNFVATGCPWPNTIQISYTPFASSVFDSVRAQLPAFRTQPVILGGAVAGATTPATNRAPSVPRTNPAPAPAATRTPRTDANKTDNTNTHNHNKNDRKHHNKKHNGKHHKKN
ncbi:MAG: hypothetical protein ACR2J8_10330 [Thermomicrobiales bacterium]